MRAIAIKFVKPICFDFVWLILNILAVYLFNWQQYKSILFSFDIAWRPYSPSYRLMTTPAFIMGNIFIVNVLGSFILLLSYFFTKPYKKIIATTKPPYISGLSYLYVLGNILLWILLSLGIVRYNPADYATKVLILILLIYLKEQNDLNVNNYKLLTFKEKLIKKLGIIVNSIMLIILNLIILIVVILVLSNLFIIYKFLYL